MTLAEYLTKYRLSATAFAAKVPCAPSTITRIINGESEPSLAMAQAITLATRGRVRLADFLAAEEME